jgi:peptidoglycan/LPS O-acetylase OafA/YrhL
MSAPHASRSRELDALRGIAAMMVILFHYTIRYGAIFGDPAAPFRLTYGYFGVELFFGVSGFVILMTLTKSRSPADFVIARFMRLFPAYWVALIATFIIVRAFPLVGRTPDWPTLLVNLTMLQQFFGVADVDGVYWSLALELAFYGWMLIVLAAGWLRHVRPLAIAWLVVSIAVLAATHALSRSVPVLLSRYLIVEQSAFFAIGAAAYLDFAARRITRSSMAIFALALVASWLAQGFAGFLVACLMVAVFSLLVIGRAGLLDNRPLVFLGTVSYPLYLLHDNIGFVIIQCLRNRHVDFTWAMLVAVAISLIGATALTFGVERPVQRRVRDWRQRRRAVSMAEEQARRASLNS